MMNKADYYTEYKLKGEPLFNIYDARGRAFLKATGARNGFGVVLHNGRGIDATVGFMDDTGISVYDTEVHCTSEKVWEFGDYAHDYCYFPARKEDMFGRSQDVLVDTPSYDIDNTLYFYTCWHGTNSLFFNCRTIQHNAEFVNEFGDYWYRIPPTFGVPYQGRDFIEN